MKKFYNWGSALLIGALGLGLLVFSKDTAAGATAGINLCVTAVFPSLFPFFVLSSLFIERGMAVRTARLLALPSRVLFGISGSGASAFLMGIIGGYPIGVKTAVALYQNGTISKKEAQRLLCFCNNSGPAFILGVVGVSLFGNLKLGVFLYLIHIAASVIMGIALRLMFGSCGTGRATVLSAAPEKSMLHSIISAVTGSFHSMLNVCAFVIFFAVIIRLLNVTGALEALSQGNAVLSAIFSAAIEVTSGLWQLGALHLSNITALAVCAFMLGWAGFSVHFQAMSFLTDTDLSSGGYLISKLAHGLLSVLLVYACSVFFPSVIPAFGYGYYDPYAYLMYTQMPDQFFYGSLILSGLTLVFFAILYFSIVFFEKRRYNKEKD